MVPKNVVWLKAFPRRNIRINKLKRALRNIPVKSPEAPPMDFCSFDLLKRALGIRRTRTPNELWKAVQGGTWLKLVTRQATVRYLYHSATAATPKCGNSMELRERTAPQNGVIKSHLIDRSKRVHLKGDASAQQ
ncbi:hypothetical protein TNCV_3409191 [Trichonephila clavipes]|nr:hypothetical protein TNCV_3409191 [Trichonephila clavipes]